MIVHVNRTMAPELFTQCHPRAHIVVGHYDPDQPIDEDETGQPGFVPVLVTAMNALKLRGVGSWAVDRRASTIWLAFERFGDAAAVCDMVNAVRDRSYDQNLTMSFFNYDETLYWRLRAVRDERLAEIEAAFLRREEVAYVGPEGCAEGGDRQAAAVSKPAWPVRGA